MKCRGQRLRGTAFVSQDSLPESDEDEDEDEEIQAGKSRRKSMEKL